MKVHLIYFSPAFSTRKIMRMLGESMDMLIEEHDVTMGLNENLLIEKGDLAVFGVPVYAGRVPHLAAEAFAKIKGDRTFAVVVNVYGNRDYDDALLELKNICQTNGFVPIAAGAFIACHVIFPHIANGRPDVEDEKVIIDFGKKCYEKYCEHGDPKPLNVKGNFPYKDPGTIPLTPTGNAKCDKCGTCVRLCPVGAIPIGNPRKTDKTLCISCARCISVCHRQARGFRGLLYSVVKRKFASKFQNRKSIETFFS